LTTQRDIQHRRLTRRCFLHAPPAALAPFISGELAEAADRHRLTALEAAAYQRLGVPILEISAVRGKDVVAR